jgi:hypothetical protein
VSEQIRLQDYVSRWTYTLKILHAGKLVCQELKRGIYYNVNVIHFFLTSEAIWPVTVERKESNIVFDMTDEFCQAVEQYI